MNIISNNPAPRTLASSLSGGGVNSAMERVSSGLRVNTAKDDAAGMSISGRFTSQTTSGKTVVDDTDGVRDVVQISNEALAGAEATQNEAQTAQGGLAAGQQAADDATTGAQAAGGTASAAQTANGEGYARLAAAVEAAAKGAFNNSTKISDSIGAGVIDQHTGIENATVTHMSGAVYKGNEDPLAAAKALIEKFHSTPGVIELLR